MGEIYQKALAVIAWLRQSDNSTEPALRVVKHLASIPEGEYFQRRIDDEHLDDPHLRSFVSLLRRAWFTRIGVVQEVALAKDIVILWGRFQLHTQDFKRAATYLTESEQ